MLAVPGFFFVRNKEPKRSKKKNSLSGWRQKTDKRSCFTSLLCAGTPQPDIVWYKDAVPISPVKIPRYRVLVGGSLQINGLLPDDTGMFQCFARNLAGEIQTNSYLAVTSTSVCLFAPPAWDISPKSFCSSSAASFPRTPLPFPPLFPNPLLCSLLLILFTPPPTTTSSIYTSLPIDRFVTSDARPIIGVIFFPAQPVRFTKVSPKTRPDSRRRRLCRVC